MGLLFLVWYELVVDDEDDDDEDEDDDEEHEDVSRLSIVKLGFLTIVVLTW